MSPRYVWRHEAMRTSAIAGASCGVARRMSIVIASATSRDDAPDRLHDVVDGEAEMLEQRRSRRRFAVAVDADDGGGRIVDGADVLAPAFGRSGLDGEPRNAARQDRAPVIVILPVERLR